MRNASISIVLKANANVVFTENAFLERKTAKKKIDFSSKF